MSLPFFPMFPADFEAKTSHLTLIEDGAYNRLLRICWMTPGCSMPNDEAWIMRRARAMTPAEQDAVRSVLAEFFTLTEGRFSNARLMKEWLAANESYERRKNAGAKGGKAKALKTNASEPSIAVAKLKQPQPQPQPEPEVVTAKAATTGAQQQERALPDDRGSDTLLFDVMKAVGLDGGQTPTHWMPPPAEIHVLKWVSQLGLTPEQIIQTARESRKRHHDPPNGPKALDGAMKRMAAAIGAEPLSAQPGANIDHKRGRWRRMAGTA